MTETKTNVTDTATAKAVEWLRGYYGSIDSTALVLAHKAGQRSRDAEVAELERQIQGWIKSATEAKDAHRSEVQALRTVEQPLSLDNR